MSPPAPRIPAFPPEDPAAPDGLTALERWSVAAHVAAVQDGPAALREHYRRRLSAAAKTDRADPARLAAMLAFAARLGTAPTTVPAGRHLRRLAACGVDRNALAALARLVLVVTCRTHLAGILPTPEAEAEP